MQEYSSLLERFQAPGPKRILALDGGGIRGALSLGYLEKLESLLRLEHKNPELKLCDYFDLIGGTSTGAIIAASLAIGKNVAEIKEKYMALGGEIFGDRRGFLGISLHSRYEENPLKNALDEMFGEMRMGDEGVNGIQTGLCIVTKRLDTFSTWPVSNHPEGKYFERNRFLIKELVRASTAAPTYFIPEIIDLGNDQIGTFVDGGLSMMNNPALQLYLVATTKGYPFGWKNGTQDLQLVSIGTGRRDVKLSAEKYKDPNLIQFASLAPEQFMHDASELVEIMMQFLSFSPTPRELDKQIGMAEASFTQRALTYMRYNISLDRESLDSIGITEISNETLEDLTNMDDAENRFILAEIGKRAAEKQIRKNHFDPVFFVR